MSALRIVLYRAMASGVNPERTTLLLAAYQALDSPGSSFKERETWTRNLLSECGVIKNGDPSTFVVHAPGANFVEKVTTALT